MNRKTYFKKIALLFGGYLLTVDSKLYFQPDDDLEGAVITGIQCPTGAEVEQQIIFDGKQFTTITDPRILGGFYATFKKDKETKLFDTVSLASFQPEFNKGGFFECMLDIALDLSYLTTGNDAIQPTSNNAIILNIRYFKL